MGHKSDSFAARHINLNIEYRHRENVAPQHYEWITVSLWACYEARTS